jgi:uncharacterized membrane protein
MSIPWRFAIWTWVAVALMVAVGVLAGRVVAQNKEALDQALARATTTSECLTVARRYQSLGMAADTKRAVDRCATMAKAASEWHAISNSYQQLGYQALADEAFRKANNAPMR